MAETATTPGSSTGPAAHAIGPETDVAGAVLPEAARAEPALREAAGPVPDRPPVRVIRPVPPATWHELFEADLAAVVTQSPAWWAAALGGNARRDLSALYELDSGRRVLLPLLEPRWSRGLTVASWPRVWGVGGPLADGPVTASEARSVLDDVASLGRLFAGVRLRDQADVAWLEAAGDRFRAQATTRYVLDLAGGFDEVWRARFSGTARTAVRRAERSGVEVEVDHSGRLLPLYWELHRATVRRWAAERPGTPKWVTRLRSRWVNPTSPRLLERVARHFGSGFAVWLARVDGRPAASIVVLTTGREAQYRWGAMDKELAGPTHASDLLQRLAIEQACRARLARYDMGGAETGTPLARWKQKFGATPRRNHFLVAATPALHEARRLAGRALSAAQP